MSKLGSPRDMTSPASAHQRWLRRAGRVAPLLEPADRLPLLVERATALLLLGREEGWAIEAQIAQQATAIRHRRQIAVGQLNSGEAAMMWGRYADARRRLSRALDLAEENHYRHVPQAPRSSKRQCRLMNRRKGRPTVRSVPGAAQRLGPATTMSRCRLSAERSFIKAEPTSS
jgi:hypothetical protein